MSMSDLQAMFQQAASQQQARQPLVEFRAGRMNRNAQTKMVTADPRKGKIAIVVGEEGLHHFQWLLRPSSAVDLDLVLVPGEAVFERVHQCVTGRAYTLRLLSDTSRRFIFWMQDASADRDEERCRKVNDILAGRGAAAPRGSNAAPLSSSSSSSSSSPSAPYTHEQLLALLNAASGSTTQQGSASSASVITSASTATNSATAATVTASSTNASAASTTAPVAGTGIMPPNHEATIQAIMQQLYQQFQQTQPQKPDASLTDVLSAESVDKILDEAKVQERLLPLLPPTQQNADMLHAQLRSPQFRQALERLQHALSSQQVGSVLLQFGLPSSNDTGVEAFLRAIVRQAQQQPSSAAEPKKEEQPKP